MQNPDNKTPASCGTFQEQRDKDRAKAIEVAHKLRAVGTIVLSIGRGLEADVFIHDESPKTSAHQNLCAEVAEALANYRTIRLSEGNRNEFPTHFDAIVQVIEDMSHATA